MKNERAASELAPGCAGVVTLSQILVVLERGTRSREGIVDDLGDRAIPRNVVDAGIELAVVAGLATDVGGRLGISASGSAFASAALAQDLDVASAALEAYEPYSAFLRALRARGRIPRTQAASAARREGARVSEREARALASTAVHLGQAYTTLGSFLDGSARPEPAALGTVLEEVFAVTAEDGLSNVSAFMPKVTARLRISPHALNRALSEAIEAGAVPDLGFWPSAGGPVRARDAVLDVGEIGFELRPVPLDRLYVGNRPVFVVVRQDAAP